MKEDLGLKMLREMGLITIDDKLVKCSPKWINLYLKVSNIKEGETPESYCYRMSKEMFSDILQMWINTQKRYKQKKEDVYSLFSTVLSINLTNMEKYLEELHHK